jgi:hypothetical protein
MKNSQNGITTSVIIAIVAVIVALGAYLIFATRSTPNTVDNTNAGTNTGVSTNTPDTNNNSNPATSTTSTGTVSKVKIALYAPGDAGASGPKFGCDDSLILVNRDITPTQAPLKAALETLFSIKTKDYGQSGFQTVFDQANLKVDSAVVSASGVATVKLSGTLSLGGVCDSPRVTEQLTGTIKQFSTVKSVDIYINNQKLADYLSLK